MSSTVPIVAYVFHNLGNVGSSRSTGRLMGPTIIHQRPNVVRELNVKRCADRSDTIEDIGRDSNIIFMRGERGQSSEDL